MNSGPNWARRYGPNHRRLCARPGCGAPAAATLRFQPTQREAWLVDLDDDAIRTEGDLCARHAAGLVLPRGWELHNDLSATRDETTRAAPPVRRTRRASVARARPRRGASSAVELPGLAAVDAAEAPAGPRIATPAAGTPAPSRPRESSEESSAAAGTPGHDASGESPGESSGESRLRPWMGPARESSDESSQRVQPAVAADPDPAPLVAPASPEARVELAETLDAQTPLLKRAFRNVARPDDDT